MHCPRHQKEDTEVAKSNNLADPLENETAKGTFIMVLVPVLDMSPFDPEHSTAVLEKAKSWGFDEEGPNSRWRKKIRKEIYCFLNI